MKLLAKAKAKNAAAAVAVLTLCLSGCSGTDTGRSYPNLSLAQVRETQNLQLQEFIDMVPEDEVIEVWGPIPEMAAMSCDTDLGGERLSWKEESGSYQLPGGAEIYVAETLDGPGLFESFARRQEFVEWTAAVRRDDGTVWQFESPDGYSYYLSYVSRTSDGKSAILLSSFSPCFIPDREISLHREY